MKKTKIISSIWPATRTEEKIIDLYHAWVNVIRINFSHADYENTSRIVEIVKRLNEQGITKLWLLGDLKGPEIRLGDYEGAKTYKKWDVFNIYVDPAITCTGLDQFCDYPYLVEDVQVGQVVRIESGIFDVLVKEKTTNSLVVEALNDTTIKQRRHVNLPGTKIKLPGLIPQDRENVNYCIENDFNYIAMSFVRNKEHIEELRSIIRDHGKEWEIGIISKVENQEGLDNIRDIVEASDGVMVARGDLGIEIDIALIPVRQRKIVKLCRERGRIVIVATQLIESMMESPFPTRAEVSDIFNAVMQKADAVMTSWETALGKYPIECISMMKNIIMQAEESIEYKYEEFHNDFYTPSDLEKKALIRSAIDVANNLGIKSIILFTKWGKLARIAAAYRSRINFFAFTNRKSTFTASALYFGVKSRYIPYNHHSEALEQALRKMIQMGDIEWHEKTLVVTDIKKNGYNNPVLEIISPKDYLGME